MTNLLRQEIYEEFEKSTQHNAFDIEKELINIDYLMGIYQDELENALDEDAVFSEEDEARLAYDNLSGAFLYDT